MNRHPFYKNPFLLNVMKEFVTDPSEKTLRAVRSSDLWLNRCGDNGGKPCNLCGIDDICWALFPLDSHGGPAKPSVSSAHLAVVEFLAEAKAACEAD